MTQTTCDYLEKGAEYCERRPFPIDNIQVTVTKLGIHLRWRKKFPNDKILQMGRYVDYTTLERCKENPIILTAKGMEEEIMKELREKKMILEKVR